MTATQALDVADGIDMHPEPQGALGSTERSRENGAWNALVNAATITTTTVGTTESSS